MNAAAWIALGAMALSSPSPEPAQGAAALREIGRVRASACPTIVRSANIAIIATLHNDVLVKDAIRDLRNVQLDASVLWRAKGLHELGALAANLRTEAIRGIKESVHLREIAMRIQDKERREGLLSFTNALGGALTRQERVARDLQVFIAHAHSILAVTPEETPGPAERALVRNANPAARPALGGGPDGLAIPLDPMAREAADAFEARRPAIDADEVRAVDSVVPAFRNCTEPVPAEGGR